MMQSDISFGFMVSQEMMPDVYVLCQFDGTLIVTQKGNLG
jgi:hypothetical protein